MSYLSLSILFFLLSTTTAIPRCPSFTCSNNGINITYPFWVSQDSTDHPTSFCGYRELMLSCRNETPVLSLSGQDYAVTSIDYSATTLSLTDFSILQDPHNACPRPRCNLTSDTLPDSLTYTGSDSNLTFFFNCSGDAGDGQIICLAGVGKHSYVFPDDAIPLEYNWTAGCEEAVVAPVHHAAVVENMHSLYDVFGGILRQGFQLQWNPANGAQCASCEGSGGRCGYTNRTGSDGLLGFVCLCSNGSHGRDCYDGGLPGKSGSHTTRNIIIGVCVGVAALFAGCCFCFLWYQRRKRQQRSNTSNLLSSTASSKPSSIKDPELGTHNYNTHVFSYEELQEATNGFDASRELGDGGFGTVYKGTLRDGRVVAVKRLYENNYKRVEQFVNEVLILSGLRHQNLVTLYGCTSHHSRELLLVYEFVPNGTVADHLHGLRATEGALTWAIRLNIAIETASALAYLHAIEPQIIHRDVKTNNILLDKGFHVKVADFGLSRLFPVHATHVSTLPQGTPGYVDPEYHQCYQLTDKSDVYSFGVVLVELISSKPAVDISRHRHEINLANMAIVKIQNNEWDQLIDPGLGYQADWEMERMIKSVAELAFRCLQGDRNMRPSIKEVMEELKTIQSRGEKEEVEADVKTTEDTGLLKNTLPYSPDSVTKPWESTSTTPNTSS